MRSSVQGHPHPADRRRVSVGVDVLLRVVAIGLIVMQHATNFSIYGGSWILVAVMGFSSCTFPAAADRVPG